MEERLQKILSQYGVCSRRQAETLISEGCVSVNGHTAVLGETADAEKDRITVNGTPLAPAPDKVYFLLNKPRGYVTTLQDEKGRKTVSELMAVCGHRVWPVGRLDLNSEGLLLMTNDGELTNLLTHPKGEIEKKYHVWISDYRESAMSVLTSSIVIDGKKTVPAKVRVLSAGKNAMLEFTLYEGRNRQIRRLCEAAGLTVTRLKRIQEGDLRLGDLAVGKWRPLTADEIEGLRHGK